MAQVHVFGDSFVRLEFDTTQQDVKEKVKEIWFVKCGDGAQHFRFKVSDEMQKAIKEQRRGRSSGNATKKVRKAIIVRKAKIVSYVG